VKDLAVPVLAHRVVVGTDGRLGGVGPEETIAELLRTTPVPS
jgi:MoxR-like ATPase